MSHIHYQPNKPVEATAWIDQDLILGPEAWLIDERLSEAEGLLRWVARMIADQGKSPACKDAAAYLYQESIILHRALQRIRSGPKADCSPAGGGA